MAPTICAWQIDCTRYVATPLMRHKGRRFELRALFEQYDLEHLCAVETLVARCAAEAAKMVRWR
jgi:hypothetical protein